MSKLKFIALKDLWYEAQGKIENKEKYEAHRAELAQMVWNDMKANDSETCQSCHSFDAMELSKQTKLAKQTHTDAQTNGPKPVLIAIKALFTSFLKCMAIKMRKNPLLQKAVLSLRWRFLPLKW